MPIQLQVIEADHIDTMKDGPAEKEGHYWVQGVELDALGRRTGYWIFRNHPGDHRRSMSLESVFVPAQSMLHIYRVDRPGQVRGIPWAAPVVIRSRELKDYEDAQLLRQKIAACFALFRQDMAFDLDADVASPAASSEKEELGRDYVEPGMMIDLPAGKEIKFASPPSVSGYEEFVTRQLRAIAVGLGVSYEALTGDFSSVNFSSGRMGHIEFQRNVAAWQSAIMVTQFCRPVWRWFSTVATLMGVRDEGLQPSWILPRREMIDPTREVPAAIQKIRGGLTTLSDEIRSQGMDPAEVFLRLASERDLLNALGITTESDPAQAKEWRMPNAEGAASRE